MLQKVPDLNFRQDFDDDYNHEPETEVAELSNEIDQQPNEARQFSETEGAQRRGIVLDDSASELKKALENKQKQSVNRIGTASFFAHHDHMLTGSGKGYDRNLCATLRVPCRFVTDHPCCNYGDNYVPQR